MHTLIAEYISCWRIFERDGRDKGSGLGWYKSFMTINHNSGRSGILDEGLSDAGGLDLSEGDGDERYENFDAVGLEAGFLGLTMTIEIK